MDAQSKAHITRTPGICGERPCIGGTRIRVQDVYVWHELMGQSPDEIVSTFPQLSLADVYAALAYFWDHQGEIEADLKEEDQLVKQLKSGQPSKLPSRLKLEGTSDPEQITFALQNNREIVIADKDFLFCGRASQVRTIIEFLILIDACLSEQEMDKHIEFC